MDLMDLLKAAGGGNSVNEVGNTLGLGAGDTANLVKALAPALMRGFGKQAATDDGLAGLRNALGSGHHQDYINDPARMRDDATRTDGNKILGHIFGSKDVSRNVAAQAAQETGISASLIKKALPMLAGLAMGAMSKKSSAGRELGTSAASGGLGPLAGLIDSRGDGVGIDDVLGLARKFF